VEKPSTTEIAIYRVSVCGVGMHIFQAIASRCFEFVQSVQRWATGWTVGVLGLDSRRGLGIFPFTTASRQALGPTQPPIQWVTWALSLEVKRTGHEADHFPPSIAEVKNAWSYTFAPPICLNGVMLS
jgi:hypothetical protein